MLKQEVINAVSSLPENASLEDIMYQLYIMGKHEKSLTDIDAGRVYDTSDVRKSVGKSV